MENNARLAVKAFIISPDKKVLLIKRASDDPHYAGIWEIPGGRLSLGEDPFEGLKREVKEETNLTIEVKNPISVNHFIRDDGQKVTLIVFLCKSNDKNVKLSEEHTEFLWIDLREIKKKLHKNFHKDADIFNKYFSKD